MADAIPSCLGPLPPRRGPRARAPAGAWDTHFHVLGPTARFPYAATRKYSPPDASLEDYFALLDLLGVERAMVVHPNTHGFDLAVTIDAVERGAGRLVGVAKLGALLTAKEAERLHAIGFRGVRFAFNPAHGGDFDRDEFMHVMGLVAPLGWFCELHTPPEALPELKPLLARLGTPVVIDHFGRIDVSRGTRQRPFEVLLELARSGQGWVKMSGADRISRLGRPYRDVLPFAEALVAAAPDQLLWGSDWPHTGYFATNDMPDDVELFDLLEELVPDSALRHRVLVDNPLRLLSHAS
jgi:predicted TIM-barrel fold metal-dependent hydrolase